MEKEKVDLLIRDLGIGYLKGRERRLIKKGINLNASPGELVALIGSNGIGKSTLLRSLCGFQEVFDGRILLNGKSLAQYKRQDLACLLSFVSTEVVRVQNLCVRDLLSLGRFPYTNLFGTLKEEDDQIIDRSIQAVGMVGYENRMLSELSDGERQRAMIARTLVQDTPLIVLDEPTAFLDIRNKYEIIHLLHNLARTENKTIVFSTHDLNIATSEVDKIWLMLDDEVVQGAPEDLILQGKYNKVFSGDNILFDLYGGDFRLRKNYRGSFSVQGDELEKRWTIHALARAGFIYMLDAQKAEIQVEILKQSDYTSWHVRTNTDSDNSFTSIYEMVRELLKVSLFE